MGGGGRRAVIKLRECLSICLSVYNLSACFVSVCVCLYICLSVLFSLSLSLSLSWSFENSLKPFLARLTKIKNNNDLVRPLLYV